MMRLWPILTLIVLFGCKTQEEIQREQMVDNISLQMVQNQQMTADGTVRLQAIEERLGMLTGQMEEKEYRTLQQNQQDTQNLKEKISVLELKSQSQQTALDKANQELNSVRAQLAEQKKFLDQVLKTLSNLTGESAGKKSSSTGSLYDQAMDDYTKGRYSAAKPKLLQVLNGNQVKGNQRSRTLHNLGMIAWMDKQDDQAQTYFSRLITEHESAPQVPNGMLMLGKSFRRAKMTSEAKQILEELVKRYPKANQVTEAKKIIAAL